MLLSFRQGIARYQTDVYATPTFLQKSTLNGDYIDLIVSPDPTVVIFAHKNATYVIEETKTVRNAWGPFTAGSTRYLFWDINLLDASITRGYTNFPQIVESTPPSNPAFDQHWYDTTNHQMKVWNGSKWLEKLRVFAGSYSSQAIIVPMRLGSQVGEVGNFEGGNLILDSYNKPLRQSDGTFVTSATDLSIINASSKKIKFESEVVSGMAAENIPKFSFVQATKGKAFKLARSDDWKTRVVGLSTEDLYISEIGNIETNGLVRNEQWNWPDTAIGKPVFCGKTGEVTLVPPTTGVLQIVGYVFDASSIFLDIKNVTILSDVLRETIDTPSGPIGTSPIADFTATPLTGTAPLFVQFKDASRYAPTSWQWDFKNDGTIESTAQSPGFKFTEAGKFSVRLKVKNQYGENEVVKKDIVVVDPAPILSGLFTNLSIEFSAPLQVALSETFPISIVVANAGYRIATNVVRTIVIDDVNGARVEITAKPTGSTVVHEGTTTTLTLPSISSLDRGQTVTTPFTIKAPSKTSVINIRAGVVSPELDSTLSDNVSTLSIRVK